MTDADTRIINRAIALLGDEYQSQRENARAALHRQFKKQCKLEKALREIANAPTYDSDAGEMCFEVDTRDIARDVIAQSDGNAASQPSLPPPPPGHSDTKVPCCEGSYEPC